MSTPTKVVDAAVRRVTVWRGDAPFQDADIAADGQVGDVVWFDLWPAAEPSSVLRAVGDRCLQLTLPQLRNVLCVDADRSSEASADGEVRLVRAFSAKTIPPAGVEPGGGVVGSLVLQPVHLLVGEGWLVTCWHAPRRFHGAECTSDIPSDIIGFDRCLASIERRWVGGLGSTAADLGVLVLHELALTFGPAHRELAAWLGEWELNLYRDGDLDQACLPVLWGSMATLRDWIAPLNRVGTRADIDRAWFRGASDAVEVERVDDYIDRSLRNLGELAHQLRASFAVQHARVEELARERKEDRQRRVEYVATIFLVPTLVVGFYGANTRLPGGGTWTGFREMLLAMVILTCLAVFAVWRSNRESS